MSLGAVAMADQSGGPLPPYQAQPLAQLPSLDLSSRADSDSGLSQASAGCLDHAGASLHTAGSGGAELDGTGAFLQDAFLGGGGLPGPAASPPQKVDAKSSALKALAGVSAIVSKSR